MQIHQWVTAAEQVAVDVAFPGHVGVAARGHRGVGALVYGAAPRLFGGRGSDRAIEFFRPDHDGLAELCRGQRRRVRRHPSPDHFDLAVAGVPRGVLDAAGRITDQRRRKVEACVRHRHRSRRRVVGQPVLVQGAQVSRLSCGARGAQISGKGDRDRGGEARAGAGRVHGGDRDRDRSVGGESVAAGPGAGVVEAADQEVGTVAQGGNAGIAGPLLFRVVVGQTGQVGEVAAAVVRQADSGHRAGLGGRIGQRAADVVPADQHQRSGSPALRRDRGLALPGRHLHPRRAGQPRSEPRRQPVRAPQTFPDLRP